MKKKTKCRTFIVEAKVTISIHAKVLAASKSDAVRIANDECIELVPMYIGDQFHNETPTTIEITEADSVRPYFVDVGDELVIFE